MADNTTLNTGAGGDTIATDDLAGVKHQRVKVEFGADGSATDVSAANPLPVGNGGTFAVQADTELPAAGALGDATANPTTSVIAAFLQCFNGTTWDRLRGDTTNGLDVDVTRSVLPTGASTSAKQPALGTAGTASADVISVQGVAAMTALKVDGSGVTQPVSDAGGSLTVDGTVTANAGTGPFPVSDNGGSLTVDNGGTFATQDSQVLTDNAAFTDTTSKVFPVGLIFDEVAGTALTENDVAAPRIDSKRAQVLTIEDETTRGRRTTVTAANALKVDGSAVTQPVSGTVTANLGTAAVTNAGTFAVQDSEKIADDAAFTVGTTKVLPTGYLADQTATDSVNEGDIGAARITLDRKQIVTIAPSADTEGLTVSNNIDIDESEDAVKASAGKLYGYHLYNSAASAVYVKFYNDTVANVVVGTTVPAMTIALPAGAAANIGWDHGIAFSAAITVAATTGVATADTGAPAANQVVGCILYQ